jgi:L-malate glycosyltransferase
MSLSQITVNRAAGARAPTTRGAGDPPARSTYLFVLPWAPMHIGGVTSVVVNLAGVMEQRGLFKPMIAVNHYSAGEAQHGEAYLVFGFSILLANTPLGLLKAFLKAPRRLWRTLALLRKHRIQVINFHYPGLDPLGVALLKRFRLYRGRLLLSYHGTDVAQPHNRIEHWAQRFVQSAADGLVACSNSLANRMVREFEPAPSRVAVVFNGVNESIFRRDALDGKARLQMPEWFVVNVGSFIPRKNHMLLIDAFARLAPRYPGLHLCIAGADGPERPAVQAAVDRAGLTDRVHLFIDLDQKQVATLLARSAVCVQPSLAESFPLALLEAAASGTPVVASDIPGHDELIQERVNGMLFPLADAAACATAIATLLDDPGSATTMATAQSEQVREKFTLVSCLREYERIATRG